MSLDIDIIKARAKNEYRLSKVRGEAMISVRIPGGIMPAHLLAVAQQIAEQYGKIMITTGAASTSQISLERSTCSPEKSVMASLTASCCSRKSRMLP